VSDEQTTSVITTEEQLSEMVEHYLKQDAWVWDTEANGPKATNPLDTSTQLRWMSFACEDRADSVPMGFPNGEYLPGYPRLAPNKKGNERMTRGIAYEDLNPKYDLSVQYESEFSPPPSHLKVTEALPILEPMFRSGATKIAHNLRYDAHITARHMGFYPENPYWDTMIAAWVEDSRRQRGRGLSLQACVERDLGGKIKKGVGENILAHSFSEVSHYALRDAQWEWFLYLYQIEDPRIVRLMTLEMQVMNPVLEMESTGVRIDKPRLAEIDGVLRAAIDAAQYQVFRAARKKFNLRSTQQKQELFYLPKSEGGLGIRAAKPTKGGAKKPEKQRTIYDYSVDNAVMEANAAKHPLIRHMIEFGQLTKIHGTYVVPYLGGDIEVYDESGDSSVKHVETQLIDGRIFGQFKQFGAESGRFSSSQPNLQNIPSRSEIGKRVREAFVPDEGHLMIVADYSQIEPRIIASLSEDPTMLHTYRDGGDVYEAVADRMGVQRSTGKTLVLAIAYGVGAAKISADIGCSTLEARELMVYFANKFPKIGQHKNRVIGRARNTHRKEPWSETLLGRRRILPALRWTNEDLRSEAERQAYNHRIQGTAADIMKLALVNVHAGLPDSAKMLLTVHDEIVITVPEDEADEVAKIVKEEMETSSIPGITVPLIADVNVVSRWSEAK
jgi:DNA polymerase I-like protein with 3'-5' exonuclease and polymerase domains